MWITFRVPYVDGAGVHVSGAVSCSACAGWCVGDRRGARLALHVRGACGLTCCLVGGRCVWTVLVGAFMLRALVVVVLSRLGASWSCCVK